MLVLRWNLFPSFWSNKWLIFDEISDKIGTPGASLHIEVQPLFHLERDCAAHKAPLFVSIPTTLYTLLYKGDAQGLKKELSVHMANKQTLGIMSSKSYVVKKNMFMIVFLQLTTWGENEKSPID